MPDFEDPVRPKRRDVPMPGHIIADATRMRRTPYPKYGDISFRDFLGDRGRVIPGRPLRSGLAKATVRKYFGAIRRLSWVAFGDKDWLFNNVPQPAHVTRIYEVTHIEQDPVRLEDLRHALRWYFAWRGVPPSHAPDFIQESWDPTPLVAQAQAEGRMRRFPKRFTIQQVKKLLIGQPFVTKGMRNKMWGRDQVWGVRERVRYYALRYRLSCLYRDAQFRLAHLLMSHTGRRSCDLVGLKVDRIHLGPTPRIVGWPDVKKGGEPVDVPFLEEYVFREIQTFLLTWRWIFAGNEEETDGCLFLTTGGVPYSDNGFRMTLSEGIHILLGDHVPANHGERRFYATLRFQNGWPIGSIALGLNDEPDVTWNNYVDKGWVRTVGRITPEDDRRTMTPSLDPALLLQESPTIGRTQPFRRTRVF